MSKKISDDKLRGAIKAILDHAADNANFVESIDLQITLKNFDPRNDKRFSGSVILPNPARPNMSFCVIGTDPLREIADKLKIDNIGTDQLKGYKRDKKLVKKLSRKYDAFIAADKMVKLIPRHLGPGLNKAGKFPTPCTVNDSLEQKMQDIKCTVKFQLKKEMCLGTAVANIAMTPDEIRQNCVVSINFLVSLLKKNWQNIRSLSLKSTQGPVQRIY